MLIDELDRSRHRLHHRGVGQGQAHLRRGRCGGQCSPSTVRRSSKLSAGYTALKTQSATCEGSLEQSTRLTDPSNTTTSKFLEYRYEETGISSRMRRNPLHPEHVRVTDKTGTQYLAATSDSQFTERPSCSHPSHPPAMATPTRCRCGTETAMTLMIHPDVNPEAYQ